MDGMRSCRLLVVVGRVHRLREGEDVDGRCSKQNSSRLMFDFMVALVPGPRHLGGVVPTRSHHPA